MKLRLILFSIVTIFTVSTGLHALVGEIVEGAGEIVSDVGRGVSNVGESISGRDYFGDRYVVRGGVRYPVRARRTHRVARPVEYVEPLEGEVIYSDY